MYRGATQRVDEDRKASGGCRLGRDLEAHTAVMGGPGGGTLDYQGVTWLLQSSGEGSNVWHISATGGDLIHVIREGPRTIVGLGIAEWPLGT
ncbi:hypothetical protein NDU88_002393 [Pleurodeles waltl]|uniref:Uncharacterized protein n=1 Tax=Pleurodeles waltl TaxID=8319 RepID=A0AAV7WPR5_PLEWA|nr:hypothetical protein NDU88_002393 [Pleurodeles waltl]